MEELPITDYEPNLPITDYEPPSVIGQPNISPPVEDYEPPLEDIIGHPAALSTVPVDNTPAPKRTSLSQNDVLADPTRMGDIRKAMIARFGTQWEDRSDQEVLDSYVSHMRYVNTNELHTLSEMRAVLHADDEKKSILGKAYTTYEEMNNLFSESWGEIDEGVGDYISSIMTSPSTYIGWGVGRGIATGMIMPSMIAARKAATNVAMKEAYRTGGKQAAQRVMKKAVKQGVYKEIALATGIDTGLTALQDVMYQATLLETGAQDHYSPLQTSLVSGLGIVGGGVAALPHALRGASGLDEAGRQIRAARSTRRAAARTTASPRIAESLQGFTASMQSWRDMVEAGKVIDSPLSDMERAVGWFFDMENENSVSRIIIDSGADVSSPDTPFTHQLIQFARGMPQEDIDAFNAILQPTGQRFGDLLDIVAAAESFGGEALGQASQASRYAGRMAARTAEEARANSSILRDGAASVVTSEEIAASPQIAKYMASVWRRALVSHPGTTAVNVVGWGQAYTARALAEMIHAGGLGMTGYAGKMVSRDWADPKVRQSKALLENQVFKLRTFMDPYSSRQAWDHIMTLMPKKYQDAAMKMIFGGIDQQNPAAIFGLKVDPVTGRPASMAVRGAEAYVDKAALWSMVKLQDSWTKSFSGLSELDKLSRLEYGKGIDELLADGEYNLITDAMWERTVRTTLEDTFSADYTKGQGMLNNAAHVVERLSNGKYTGFLFPFGKFMNNNLGFFLKYSPVGFLNAGSLLYKGQSFDAGTKASQAMVGSLAMAYLMSSAEQEMSQGNQWYESEESTGDILNRQNIAPSALFKITSRMLELYRSGNGIPKELWAELGNQMGINQWSREVTGDTVLHDLIKYMSAEDNPDNKNIVMEAVNGAMEYMAGIGSGYLRPFDPLNRMVGMATEGDVLIDRRQAEPGIDAIAAELSRYTSNIFAPFIGEPYEEGGANLMGPPVRSATQPGNLRDPNPISGMITRKEQPPKNNINRLLGMVNLPPFSFDHRSRIPEFDRFINTRVAPLLEKRAAELIDSPVWKNAPHARKVQDVRNLLTTVRDDIKDVLDDGHIGSFDDRLNRQRASWTAMPATERNAARTFFNIDTPDRKLSMQQLNLMKNYIDMRNEYSDELQDQL